MAREFRRDDASTSTRALQCLEELALEKGLDDVSMRDVAKRLDISLAALQYHYPSKAALIDAFVRSVVDTHRRRLERTVSAADGRPRFVDAVRYLMALNTSQPTGDLLDMIYARAHHDEATARSLRLFHDSYLEAMRDLVAADFPALSEGEAVVAATLTVSLLEGLADVHEVAVARGVSAEALTRAAVAAASAMPTVVRDVSRRAGRPRPSVGPAQRPQGPPKVAPFRTVGASPLARAIT